MKEYDKALKTYEEGLQHAPDNEELRDGITRAVEAISKVLISIFLLDQARQP